MSYTYEQAGVYPVCLAVRDELGSTASITKNIIVTPATSGGANPPTIMLTTPGEGLLAARPGNLMVQADASAVSGTVASVEFWLNGEPYSWDSLAPFNATLSALPPGRHRLAARVSDTTGNSTTTPAVNFRVLSPEDAEPIPSISGGLLSMTYYRFTDGTVRYTVQRSSNLTG
jgi:hypothetical protein